MNRVIDYFKQYIGIISIVLAVCILLTYSLSYFKVNIDNKRAAEMYIGELKYSIEIDGNSTNTLTVPAGETIVDVNVTNQNGVDTYFKLLYLENDNVTISYYDETKNTSEVYTKYLSSGDLLEKSLTGTLKLKIINNSSSVQTLTFSVSGGYSTNKLTDVEVPSIYSEITTMVTTSTNTYFCETNTSDPLSQGLNYVDGQYTYSYMQEMDYIYDLAVAEEVLRWNNIDTNGWGISLTNKKSTDPVISKLCTYINNKPVVSMSYLFSNSQITTLDVSSFNTSKVINMMGMFSDSQIEALDLSNFDTSNVTNMKKMFYYSNAKTLNLSSFDTSKVTDMGSRFVLSKATELNLSSFNTSNVTNMENMFNSSKASALDLSDFNTSKVTNMASMFWHSAATTIDVSSFDTSKVTSMYNMFGGSKATSLDLSSFDTSSVTDMDSMFHGSEATVITGLNNFNTSNVTTMKSMFCISNASILDLSSFDTGKVTNMYDMFWHAKVKTIYASDKFITDNVTNSQYMFYNASNLVGGNGTKCSNVNIDKTYARIDKSGTPGYFTLKN